MYMRRAVTRRPRTAAGHQRRRRSLGLHDTTDDRWTVRHRVVLSTPRNLAHNIGTNIRCKLSSGFI
jgi:hypothetical protein